tara:strand:+ start:64 stop:768 length:705 start_codon:yes stop_codon:yes gene_type:complete
MVLFFHLNKNYFFILLISFTALFGQVKNNRSFFSSDKYVLGGFINANDVGLDLEVLANLESRYGVYGSIWFSQIDYYSNTDILSNTSIGFNKKFQGGFSLDLGYSYNYSFSNDPEQLPEIYLGADIKNISVWTYIGNDGVSFESWYKPNIIELNKSNLDLLFYGHIEKNGYDVSINISNQLSKKLIAGIMLGYEQYSENNKITFKKNNQTKTVNITDSYSGFSSMVYLGFLLNN